MDYSVLSDRVIVEMDELEEIEQPIILLNEEEPEPILTGTIIGVGIGCRELDQNAVGKRIQLMTNIFAPFKIGDDEYSITEEKNIGLVWQ